MCPQPRYDNPARRVRDTARARGWDLSRAECGQQKVPQANVSELCHGVVRWAGYAMTTTVGRSLSPPPQTDAFRLFRTPAEDLWTLQWASGAPDGQCGPSCLVTTAASLHTCWGPTLLAAGGQPVGNDSLGKTYRLAQEPMTHRCALCGSVEMATQLPTPFMP